MTLRTRLGVAAALLLGCLLASGVARGDDLPLVSSYIEALELEASGDAQAALARLEELATDRPDSAAVHASLARLALATGTEDEWRSALRKRVRRTARDVGASIGLSVLENARDRRSEAHRLLMTALTAESRDPLLVPLLLQTTDRPAGLAAWFEKRHRVLPRDTDFAALRVRLLLALDRVEQAREVLARARELAIDHVDLLALASLVELAAGDEDAACEAARVSLGFKLAGPERIDVAMPRRIWIARALTACGAPEEAERVLSSMRPFVHLADAKPHRRALELAVAEARVGRGDPVGALALVESASEAVESVASLVDADALEESVRTRALYMLGGLDPASAESARDRPDGLALADHAISECLRASVARAPEATTVERLERLADALASQGLSTRALRVRAVAVDARRRAGLSTSPARPSEDDDPEIHAALALVAARTAPADEQRAALAAVDDLALVGAPGQLRAALRERQARAAFARGDRVGGLELARAALLDLLEADRAGQRLAAELWGLAGDAASRAARLAGSIFSRSVDGGAPLEEAARLYVRDLGRAARTWSVLEITWESNLSAIHREIPDDACVVVDGGPPATRMLVFGAEGRLAAPPRDAWVEESPCAEASTIRWLGPAAAPGGLALPDHPGRLLLRIVAPSPVPDARPSSEPRRARRPGEGLVGDGEDRPLARIARAMTGTEGAAGPSVPSGDDEDSDVAIEHARAYAGAGIATDAMSLASGWLVPPSPSNPQGWMGPEHLLTESSGASFGLVAIGLASDTHAGTIERGAWALAEAALAGGRPWALLSRRPLDAEEWEVLDDHLRRIDRDPEHALRKLARKEPELAAALGAWTAPGRWPSGGGGAGFGTWALVVAPLAAVAVAWGVRRRARRKDARR
jgi:tetratricopeptide (TPR) repeat protein